MFFWPLCFVPPTLAFWACLRAWSAKSDLFLPSEPVQYRLRDFIFSRNDSRNLLLNRKIVIFAKFYFFLRLLPDFSLIHFLSGLKRIPKILSLSLLPIFLESQNPKGILDFLFQNVCGLSRLEWELSGVSWIGIKGSGTFQNLIPLWSSRVWQRSWRLPDLNSFLKMHGIQWKLLEPRSDISDPKVLADSIYQMSSLIRIPRLLEYSILMEGSGIKTWKPRNLGVVTNIRIPVNIVSQETFFYLYSTKTFDRLRSKNKKLQVSSQQWTWPLDLLFSFIRKEIERVFFHDSRIGNSDSWIQKSPVFLQEVGILARVI